jgi:hypothetical protein
VDSRLRTRSNEPDQSLISYRKVRSCGNYSFAFEALGAAHVGSRTGGAEIVPRWKAKATGSFVLKSKNAPRMDASYAHYRCVETFERLTN